MKNKFQPSNLWMIIFFVIFVFSSFVLFSNNQVGALDIPVPSAILVEAETGKVLFEKKPNVERSPASITKIMTLLLGMEALEEERINLDDRVTVSDYASSMGGSQIFLGQGDIVSVEELFKAIAVASANDASVALAEAVAGSADVFINQMNSRAQELSMSETNFSNVNGLPQEDQYTTARDIVKMSRELIKYPEILEWSQIWTDSIELKDRKAMLVNTNKLILSYPELDGLKTGYTREAGFNLVATAERDEMRLISVVLGAENENERLEVTEEMLDYGFANYNLEKIFPEGKIFAGLEIDNSFPREVAAKISEPLLAVTKVGKEEAIDYELNLNKDYEFPIKPGERIGKLHSFVEDNKVHSTDILAKQRVERASIIRRIWYKISGLFR